MTQEIKQQPIYISPEYFQQQNNEPDDEIDLRELFGALWRGKWLIILCTVIFAAGAVIFAINQPNYYKAQALLAPSSGEGSSGGLGQLGGLAALAGVNIGSVKTDKTGLAIAVLKSREFQTRFINKYEVKVPLFAGIKWDKGNGELILNTELYDIDNKEWIRGVESDKSATPSDWDAYKAFQPIVEVSQNKENGLVSLSVEFLSPTLAQEWVALLIKDLNQVMKGKELLESEKNINYLQEQLKKTTIADMQSVFYQLIEEQIKNRMLAEVQDEFVFRVVDPAVVPEEKSKPKKALICVLGTLLGGLLGCVTVLLRFAFRNKKIVE
ncbi:Wzz/FepE/Etk N-terminal domain-containing protein [Motilimonas cestriensis]|uniref:Wzz/FepE/Etk N-terminal domain-containing protein n=1 Tax=Motilimonas cestriensis TaxID=2742685 RepID=UPI003DA67F7E